MHKRISQGHISLFKAETKDSVVIYAICIEVISPGVYRLSAPKIVKVTPKVQGHLPGTTKTAAASSFLLAGATAVSTPSLRPRISPYISSLATLSEALLWYSPNAPNL